MCYFHGSRPQLFDLESDPDELLDLAGDPHYATIQDGLTERVLAGWNPDEIAKQLAQREKDNAILSKWAAKTRPPESYLWDMPAGKHPSLTRAAGE